MRFDAQSRTRWDLPDARALYSIISPSRNVGSNVSNLVHRLGFGSAEGSGRGQPHQGRGRQAGGGRPEAEDGLRRRLTEGGG